MEGIIYNEDSIQTLSWQEHIRLRPGMYIGKLGDGSQPDDGIYILLKEIIDNSIDEFVMEAGENVKVSGDKSQLTIRDFGRGIPLGKLVDCVSQINTGGKYDNKAFKKSVGLNGVGSKAVNALSEYFEITSIRNGKAKTAIFKAGVLKEESPIFNTKEPSGTSVSFKPDEKIFSGYEFQEEYIKLMLWHYAYLNTGLTLIFQDEKIFSENGLKDLLDEKLRNPPLYPPIYMRDKDIEITFTHCQNQYSEEYHSFVNGQNTTQGGTHLSAFKESLVKTLRDFYRKKYDSSDIRQSIVAAIGVKIMNPVFESQTKTKLGSHLIAENDITIKTFLNDFLTKHLDNYLHKNPDIAKAIESKIQNSEKERKELSSIRKLAKERAKKSSLHNKKLRDCKYHYNQKKNEKGAESTLFITEGDSASGSITTVRDTNTQAVFSLKGKPLNCYNLSKKVVYENEEFNLLQAALNIEETIENLRYNKVIIATDADVDGMHIRLLLITFFLQFFPELILNNHLFILQTPLFRVRNKKKTIYCYNENEKDRAVRTLKSQVEITRFKGLGEINASEFKTFIGKDMRLNPIQIRDPKLKTHELLRFYMGNNTPKRQEFIIENLRIEENL